MLFALAPLHFRRKIAIVYLSIHHNFEYSNFGSCETNFDGAKWRVLVAKIVNTERYFGRHRTGQIKLYASIELARERR